MQMDRWEVVAMAQAKTPIVVPASRLGSRRDRLCEDGRSFHGPGSRCAEASVELVPTPSPRLLFLWRATWHKIPHSQRGYVGYAEKRREA